MSHVKDFNMPCKNDKWTLFIFKQSKAKTNSDLVFKTSQVSHYWNIYYTSLIYFSLFNAF